jgi:MAP/microtubule affinity-regulating kinase
MSTTPKKIKLDAISRPEPPKQQKSQSTPNSTSIKPKIVANASKSTQNISPAPKSSFMFDKIEDFVILKTLGEGNFAKVKLARHVPTNKEVAIKIIDKSKVPSKSFSKLYREIKAMSRLSHPNIIKLYQVIEDTNKLFLVVEYAELGELFDYIRVNNKMSEREARSKFRQILSAVQYCHQKRIVHR